MMARKCLFLLCLCAPFCRAQLAQTTRRRTSVAPLHLLAPQGRSLRSAALRHLPRWQRWLGSCYHDQGPILGRPFVSGDGSIAAWDCALPCPGSCGTFAIPRVFTEFQGLTPPPSISATNYTEPQRPLSALLRDSWGWWISSSSISPLAANGPLPLRPPCGPSVSPTMARSSVSPPHARAA